MKKTISTIAFLSFFAFGTSTNAGEYSDLKTKITSARDSAVTLIKNKDKRGADQQKLVKETAEAVSNALKKITPSAGKEAKFTELKNTWVAFKKVREEEIIPMAIEGKQEAAEKLANGVNKDRLQRMYQLCDELDK
jgi:uncharacterized protein YeaO (DUF488 family)